MSNFDMTVSYIRIWGRRALINTAELRCQKTFPAGIISKKKKIKEAKQ